MFDIIEALRVSNIRDVLQTIAFLFLFQYYLRSDSFHVEIITFHSVPVCLFICLWFLFFIFFMCNGFSRIFFIPF